ncbi:MAG: EAL domain-containing protein [Clostridia bacterium]|nr:EAL domain-containing protein [Clostridia bacterium]
MRMQEPEWSQKTGGVPPLISFLNETPFDELVELDLNTNRSRNLRHTEGKYLVPVLDTSIDSMYGFAIENMVHPEDKARMEDLMDKSSLEERLRRSRTTGLIQAELRFKLLDGSWRWVRELIVGGPSYGMPKGIVRFYIYDIEAEKEREHALPRIRGPYRDELTGLLTDRDIFSLAQEKLNTLKGEWCVIAIDIEYFHLFADWKGKETADELIARIGQLLRKTEQETDGLAGYRGSDDFWLLIPFNLRKIYSLYEQIKQLILSYGSAVGFMPIFGICQVNSSFSEVTDLFNHAAMTAEQAKGDQQNRIKIYNPSVVLQTEEEYKILTDFQKGLENGEVFFCLQPQCVVSSGKIVGAEALARWRQKDGTMLPPNKLIAVLEKYGMVTNLDQYIWEGVCRWLRAWLDAGHTAVPISVNISQIDIQSIDVPAFFEDLLRRYDLPAYLIKAEITESAYAGSTSAARDTVRRLRGMGLLVMMDDFGSGYSSLNMLHSLNVDVIKLDAQFLRISENNERKGISILETVVNMAKTMAIPIVVEGVETQEQSYFLADLGCRYMQGYYFYRPMTLEEFENLIRDEKRIDLRGFESKTNMQIHPREFLDENVFSDAMLNNILGPVAIYQWDGRDKVDIIRYNQQFYQMVGISVQQLNVRRLSILNYLYPDDKNKFLHMLQAASQDRLNGARGILRVYRPNGVLVWNAIQIYFMANTKEGKTFYGSSKDVTEQQFINVDLPGGYHRISTDETMEFRYISKNFQDMTGYSEQEIYQEFENQFAQMIHPDDIDAVQIQRQKFLAGGTGSTGIIRLRCKRSGYICVTVQHIITDLYGDLCFMGTVTDVTEIVKTRQSLELIAGVASACLFYVTKEGTNYQYEIKSYSLDSVLEMDRDGFARALEDNSLFRWMEEHERQRIFALAQSLSVNLDTMDTETTLYLPSGKNVRVRLRYSQIESNSAQVRYICFVLAL